ncbi:uncharacterized protein DS421_13g423200 [Arachis hypogaea]|nr:uncharacterized protein DS421_13g423200 [Arachis hypogaea]
MFHPLLPSLGLGVYLGAVERAISFITDNLWYGIFAGTNPGVGEISDVNVIRLQSPISSLIGRQVIKVGRSSVLTTGTIMAYALDGSLIVFTGQNGEKPRRVGIIWGGTANRGRLKLKVGQPPENWTSGVDLGRLLDLLELDLITTNEAFQGNNTSGTTLW